MNAFDTSFLRAVILKVAFHPVPFKRVQGAIIYAALKGGDFTADEVLPGELTNGDTKIAGIAIGSLASVGLIERAGRCKSPSVSRNGAWVNIWRLALGKKQTALTWLDRNQFERPTDTAEQLSLLGGAN